MRGRGEAMVPLSALVRVCEDVSPRELNHFGQRRSVSITASLAPDHSLGQAIAFMDQTAAKVLALGYTTELNGTSREQGMQTIDALVKASSQRLQPILMTTGAMVLGALPLALATGAGAESRQQIGWVIVGGMSLGTLLTIFVVPTMYSLFARRDSAAEGAKASPAS